MEDKKSFKNTLLMPETGFPMRGNLGAKEVEIQKYWEESGLYAARLDKNAGNPYYVLHDGPPYANGSIHTGHALNKSLKDFILRYKSMSGFYAPYIPGWDTHGLPIENALSKDRKVNRKSMSIADFRKLCEQYALEQVDIQRRQFRRLGILGDWDHPYITLDKKYEASQIRLFAIMAEKGLIYKGLKPVYWSPSSESALAEAEIEYYDISSPSIFVAMPSVKTNGVFPKLTEFLIWTTTPWTIPANMAICVGSHIEYVLVKTDNNRLFVVAKNLLDTLKETLSWTKADIQKTVLGSDLEGMTYKHPLYERISPIILGDHVTTEDGTGLVHTAPGHGEDDFNVGQKYHLDVFCPVDSRGCMTEEAGKRFQGLYVDDCNIEVIKALTEVDALLKMTAIKHSYPHDWRTHQPVIFRATEQWFASIEALKTDILKAIGTVKWYPAWGEVRIANMIKDREAWCISRQRAWGVPIPIFYTEKNTPIVDKTVIDHIADIFEQEGSNAWFEKTATELLPKNFTHPNSPNNRFTKETDIMDVWFDSGSSHHGGLLDKGLPYPADLYLEGSDQYRGWFNSSLTTGIATMGKSPYRTVVSHGWVLDGEGRKMSKSLGNTIDPNKIINSLGSDILRLWVASVDYQSDVRISDDLINQVSETYRKIRNTFKFMLGNLFDFDFHFDVITYNQLSEIDRYMLIKTDQLIKDVIEAYDDFRFDDVYRKVANFVNFISSFYLDFAKDVLYIEKANSLSRRSIQTVIYHMTDTLLRLLTPIIPHTTSEAYSYLPHKDEVDVYLLSMPVPKYADDNLEAWYDQFMILRETVLKALEEAREKKIIGKSFNAKLVLYPKGKIIDLLNRIQVNLQQVFIVSQLEVKTEGYGSYKGDDVSIDVFAAEGHTCERCWQVVDHLDEQGLCDRCKEVIR
ncbi:MAG: isoleucine--tRNA ligase [Candidatus Izemoplasmatales bacterium]|nr:isoleucine--tRNA ligase [Candidatus Izemoplasmatales bacterium]MDD3864872.1 isoleucine--tRNA ligase [Candidatus Izemoplasmatales bacterium]